jgi:hypothetical protein
VILKIDENTTIPVQWALVAIPALLGGMIWLSFIAYTSNTSAAQIVEMKAEAKEVTKDVSLQLREMNDRLSRIETKLEQRR